MNYTPPPVIIPVHTTTERRPSEAERIQIASLEVSTNEKEREMFRKGAVWYRDSETDNGVSPHDAPGVFGFVVFILLVLLVLGNIGTAIGGLMEGASRHSREEDCQLAGKWGYLFPTYKLSCKAGRWMSKE
jgi:hypothetical protein